MSKAITHLVLDTGGIICSSSLLRNSAEKFYTTPRVVQEIRDEASRRNFELWGGQVIQRVPKQEFIKKVSDFAKQTGDFASLSITDIHILALTYELEYEFNGGDWRLRQYPGQKRINGKPPAHLNKDELSVKETSSSPEENKEDEQKDKQKQDPLMEQKTKDESENIKDASYSNQKPKLTEDEQEDREEEDDGWITPSNIRKKKTQDGVGESVVQPSHLKVACATTDFAMQNVMLQIGLNLVSSDGLKIQNVKRFVLRCHGCYAIVNDMSKKFCTSCGGDTLIKTTCSINSKGEFQVHLKKNFEWKTRGTKYAIPKPVHGTPSGKGKKNPILREDQPEYQKAVRYMQRKKEVDLMDQDFLPSLLTGAPKEHLRISVGAGRRNPNEVRKTRRR
ncbi:ribosome biogenesis protein Nob1 [Schizosaccharomyces cryophilus OY26]|uniref:20S-pre-rRNA D-site endonuclease NOB1 n=1 Tax=Schizosaccharomyces cryophilus (strain OY26 / ATCC MYA-4695 / CBS 11777 / NBRC 106824 / NRRL Y48691) TaxID=653667 RepID=S9W130_SCHCR|nr:ribosome biogenesis protein Nob1 [Schizosaccharomyces cryophilus OY26]EPY52179.1 ribosome biogenesis protein Nob1 [Schizosaccharomyces cryophilus OY26]